MTIITEFLASLFQGQLTIVFTVFKKKNGAKIMKNSFKRVQVIWKITWTGWDLWKIQYMISQTTLQTTTLKASKGYSSAFQVRTKRMTEIDRLLEKRLHLLRQLCKTMSIWMKLSETWNPKELSSMKSGHSSWWVKASSRKSLAMKWITLEYSLTTNSQAMKSSNCREQNLG